MKNFNKIVIQHITEENAENKIEAVRKALTQCKGRNISFNKKIDSFFIEKAVRKMSFALGKPLKTTKGEAFFYKAQEDLTDKYIQELTEKTNNFYSFLIDYLGLPEIRILTKANLMWKGKILYSPETGKPITQEEWKQFIEATEKFLNRNYNGIGERIVLDSQALGRMIERMLETNTLEAIQQKRLEELKYKNHRLDYISQDVKTMVDVFGNSLDRDMQSKIYIATQSAAQRITSVTNKERNEIQQIIIDGIRNKQSKNIISQKLFDKCVGMNRDFQMIADTEIQNTVNEAYINEEVFKTPKGKKIYFKRFEKIDDNTCKMCSERNGMIVLYSDESLGEKQKIKDQFAKYAIWQGSGLLDRKNGIPEGVFHPYCRGSWGRYYPEVDDIFNKRKSTRKK